MNFIHQAQDAAYTCPDVHKRQELRRRIDELKNIHGLFAISCSKEDMLALVGAWTRVEIAMLMMSPDPTPTKKELTSAA